MDFLNYTVPVNLFPLTWLMPGGKLYIREAHMMTLINFYLGKLFMQAAYKTILYDLDAQKRLLFLTCPMRSVSIRHLLPLLFFL